MFLQAHRPLTSTVSPRETEGTVPHVARPSASNQAVQRVFQAKLSVSQPGDPFEREADRVADAVMRMPEPGAAPAISSRADSGPQRKCASCDECAHEEEVQRKEDGGAVASASGPSPMPQGGGRPLPAPARSFFEPRFGHDFSAVRVHTGSAADASARSIQALAYTHGRDIVFRGDQYAPESTAGRRLLAHELTHVVQQGGVASGKVFPYRPKGSMHYGDTEEEFKNSKKQPWIEKITVNFTKRGLDKNKELIPIGNLKAEYHANPAALKDINVKKIVGGSTKLGLTDQGSFKVHRIEGIGYNDGKADDPEGKYGVKKHYSKSDVASMHYAVFFNKKQAIHGGSLEEGSHSCVHVNWNNLDTIRRINYHSVIGRTVVEVNYGASVLPALCCSRMKILGAKKKGEVKNPCGNADPKVCP